MAESESEDEEEDMDADDKASDMVSWLVPYSLVVHHINKSH